MSAAAGASITAQTVSRTKSPELQGKLHDHSNTSSSDDEDSVIILRVKRLSGGVTVDRSPRIKREQCSVQKSAGAARPQSSSKNTPARQLFLDTTTTADKPTSASSPRQSARVSHEEILSAAEESSSPKNPTIQKRVHHSNSIKWSLSQTSPKLPLQPMRQPQEQLEAAQGSKRVPQDISLYQDTSYEEEETAIWKETEIKARLIPGRTLVTHQHSSVEHQSSHDLDDSASMLASLSDNVAPSVTQATTSDGAEDRYFSDDPHCEDFDRTPRKPKRKRAARRKKKKVQEESDEEEEEFELSQEVALVKIDESNIRKTRTRRRTKPTARYEPIEKVAGSTRTNLKESKKCIYKDSSDDESDDDTSENKMLSDDEQEVEEDTKPSPSRLFSTVEREQSDKASTSELSCEG
jgi:hypothetical protein